MIQVLYWVGLAFNLGLAGFNLYLIRENLKRWRHFKRIDHLEDEARKWRDSYERLKHHMFHADGYFQPLDSA
jgi:hypothetical protein